MRPVTNMKPCLLDDHPSLADAMAKAFWSRMRETGEPAVAQFWDGLGFHVDFTNPAGLRVVAQRAEDRPCWTLA